MQFNMILVYLALVVNAALTEFNAKLHYKSNLFWKVYTQTLISTMFTKSNGEIQFQLNKIVSVAQTWL